MDETTRPLRSREELDSMLESAHYELRRRMHVQLDEAEVKAVAAITPSIQRQLADLIIELGGPRRRRSRRRPEAD